MSKLKINAGNVILLKNPPESFLEHESIHINAGNALIARKVYDKLMGMGASLNSGNTNIIDVEGEVTELSAPAVITEFSSFQGCFLVCDGDVRIESEKGLSGITGLYAKRIFHPESIDLSAVKGIVSNRRVIYTAGAKLHIGNMIINEDLCAVLEENTLYWVHGDITALGENALAKIRQKNITFHCKGLTIYSSMHEKYSDMFKRDTVQLIADGYGVSGELSLDAGTSLIYGEKLYVDGDLMIPHDQAEHLDGFTSLIVAGTVTMPISAASKFKSVGKANDYDLYEGILREGNGKTIIDRGILEAAAEKGDKYTIRANGELIFADDVTAKNMEVIAAVGCNGRIIASESVRGALGAKIKYLNGVMGSADDFEKDIMAEAGVSVINTGTFKF